MFNEGTYQRYEKQIELNRDGVVVRFCGRKVKVRRAGKYRVVGSKILTKILNSEL